MDILVSIAAAQSVELHRRLEQGDAQGAAEVLHSAVPTMVDEMLRRKASQRLTADEFDSLLEELQRDIAQDEPHPPLSDFACSRESIYEGQPKL